MVSNCSNQSKVSKEAGIGLIEAAFGLPVVLMIVAGIFTLGATINNQRTNSAVAFQLARYAAAVPGLAHQEGQNIPPEKQQQIQNLLTDIVQTNQLEGRVEDYELTLNYDPAENTITAALQTHNPIERFGPFGQGLASALLRSAFTFPYLYPNNGTQGGTQEAPSSVDGLIGSTVVNQSDVYDNILLYTQVTDNQGVVDTIGSDKGYTVHDSSGSCGGGIEIERLIFSIGDTKAECHLGSFY